MYNDETNTVCPNAKKCSGCQLQNLTYAEQLKMKQARLVSLLGKFGHVNNIIGMDEPTHYRNKMQAAFGYRDGKVISGIYQSASGRIVPTDSCMLENEAADRIVVTIRNMCKGFKIKPYDLRTGKGYLRHVMVRCGFASGEIMVVLVTAKGDFPSKRSFVNELLRRHPEITTVVHNVNPTETALFLGRDSEVLYGEGYITDKLCGLDFRISPRSFYQVNTVQTEVLYSVAKKYASLSGEERVIDAYCGTGTIGLTMADAAREVIGVEVNEDAVRDAKENAKLNGITNAKFYAVDAGEFMSALAAKGEKADVVITDPPRAGCSMKFLKSLISLAPKRIVYVSCNPETLARDLRTLTKDGYKVKKIQPVDMFPYTGHVESVVCLSKEKADDYVRISVQTKDLKTKAN
ncbi:MAG: 23S rRNA (uracil(1939)-C(5))-methyltransferase RlmD [Clostridia bacterium]|nr:23S rRNA (uracil(1939)-C(5))-methyltransferase RlmD [Clostridia bacterium]